MKAATKRDLRSYVVLLLCILGLMAFMGVPFEQTTATRIIGGALTLTGLTLFVVWDRKGAL